MLIQQNSTPESVFLLVRERDGITGIENAQNIQCSVAWPGPDGFIPVDLSSLREIGGGWYVVTLPAEATAEVGLVIFVAQSADSYEWRDIHQVVAPAAPAAPAGGCSCDEVAALIDEALAVLPVQEVDVDAMIDMVVETLAVESELVRTVAPTPEPEPEPPKPNLVPAPIGEWALYCGGEITRMVSPDGATFRRQGNTHSNCQTYVVMPIDAGEYQLSFVAKATPPTELGLVMQKHGKPYTNLGLDTTALIPEQPATFTVPFAATEDWASARLRFWLGGLGDGGELQVENVRIWNSRG